MKKLFSALMTLLGLTAGTAMAEEAAAAVTEIDWSTVALSAKGLIVTAGGLAGTFLVLILFFLTIKLMQKVLK